MTAAPHGRLGHVIAVRDGADRERPMHIAHREALIGRASDTRGPVSIVIVAGSAA